jgi:hypothetical protein
MSCGGGHLEFSIGIKKQKLCRGPSNDHYMIKAKLYMNVHWMVFYKLYLFCSGMKFKMAATAGLSLTLDSLVSIVQVVSEKKHFETFFP